MPTATITCPHCSQTLTTGKGFPAGRRFRCPACGSAFTAGGPRARPLPEADEPQERRGVGLWLVFAGVVGLALLLLTGAGAALAWRFLPKLNGTAVAAGSKPSGGNAPGAAGGPGLAPGPPAAPAAEPWLPPEEQEKVNAAIDRGVAFLEKEQYPGGTWGNDHQTGLAALPGLTLLECGVPPDDPHVQNAARFVRANVAKLNTTYELALGILFLDRLGDGADEPLIRTMALRLMAGQQQSGGWTYNCPVLPENDEKNLGQILETTRPRSSLDLLVRQGVAGADDLFAGPAGGTGATRTPPAEDPDRLRVKQMYDDLSPQLRNVPALKPPVGEEAMPRGDGTDNSNTQFATLGLWAAGRHGVPMERALQRLAERFQVSQSPGGRWDYHYFYRPRGEPGIQAPAMTAAGLLGLAVGHGVTADLKGADGAAAGEDPQVELGMNGLSGFIKGRPQGLSGLYFLWSVERVGMLYGRRTIGGKEWYPWGETFLVADQKGDGSWHNGGYPGAMPVTDACFALLFLKRANLAQDLTSKVEFLTKVHDK